MGMSDFVDIKQLDEILAKGEVRATAISEQYDQGFITDEERYRLTIEPRAPDTTAIDMALSSFANCAVRAFWIFVSAWVHV